MIEYFFSMICFKRKSMYMWQNMKHCNCASYVWLLGLLLCFLPLPLLCFPFPMVCSLRCGFILFYTCFSFILRKKTWDYSWPSQPNKSNQLVSFVGKLTDDPGLNASLCFSRIAGMMLVGLRMSACWASQSKLVCIFSIILCFSKTEWQNTQLLKEQSLKKWQSPLGTLILFLPQSKNKMGLGLQGKKTM